MPRPVEQRRLLIRRYAKRYGVTERAVERMDVDQLARMKAHARNTMFSTLKWDHARPGFTPKGGVAATLLMQQIEARRTPRIDPVLAGIIERVGRAPARSRKVA